MMNDEFDDWIRHADPHLRKSGTGPSEGDDPLLEKSLTQWNQLAAERRLNSIACTKAIDAHPRWMTKPNRWMVAAIVLLAVSLGVYRYQHRKIVAEPTQKIADASPSRQVESQPEIVSKSMETLPDPPTPPIHRPLSRLEIFVAFVEKAGASGSAQWHSSAGWIAAQRPATQMELVELTSQVKDEDIRQRAVMLISQSVGVKRQAVLNHWMKDPQVRPVAWNEWIGSLPVADLPEMFEQAGNDEERQCVVTRLAESTDPMATEWLLRLTPIPEWRSNVRLAVTQHLHTSHHQRLVMNLQTDDRERRVSAAFVLSHIPGHEIDQRMYEMIRSGRYRQPAYLTLLVRNNARSRAFVSAASRQPDLGAGLYSAQQHFSVLQKQLQQWNHSEKRDQDENAPSPNTSRYENEIWKVADCSGIVGNAVFGRG
jgi:hypothetical protein